MSVFRRAESRSWTPEPAVPPFPGTTVGGTAQASMETTLRSAAAWACVQLIADTISMMPLHVCTRDQVGIYEPLRAGDPTWLASPDGVNTLPDWVYMMVVALLLRGNSPGEIVGRDGLMRANNIVWHNPDQVQFVPDPKTGRVGFKERGGREIKPQNAFVPMGYRFPGAPIGLSAIRFQAMGISTDAAVTRFALGYFEEALAPSAVLTSDQAIGQDDARTIKERIREHTGSREPLVLGGGLKLTPIAISPNESQFLETQKWSTATIARIFRVPPEMIGAEAGNSMTYSNVEQRAIDFLTYTIQPWLTRIESAMSALLPRGQFFRFDTSVLLRSDLETTLRATAIGIASKQMTPDEARAMRDQAPLSEAQKTLLDLIPLTVAPTGRPSALSPGKPGVVTFNKPTDEGGDDGPTD